MGVCGVFATELIKRMFNLGITDARIRVFGSSMFNNVNVETVEQTLHANFLPTDDVNVWNENGVNFGHIIVEWRGYHFDGEFCKPLENRWYYSKLFDGALSVDVADALAQQPKGWNRSYNRAQNPKVCAILDECFALLS